MAATQLHRAATSRRTSLLPSTVLCDAPNLSSFSNRLRCAQACATPAITHATEHVHTHTGVSLPLFLLRSRTSLSEAKEVGPRLIAGTAPSRDEVGPRTAPHRRLCVLVCDGVHPSPLAGRTTDSEARPKETTRARQRTSRHYLPDHSNQNKQKKIQGAA